MVDHAKDAVEQWLGKALPPRSGLFERMGSGQSEFVVRQLAIGVNDAGQRIGIEQLGTDRIVCRGESLIVAFGDRRSEEHTSELQSLMRIAYAVFCLQKKKNIII